MELKEAMALEAASVFANPAEFGRLTRLEGKTFQAVISGPKTALTPIGDDRPGVIFETAVLNYPAGFLPLPKADREVDWEGQKWMVMQSHDNDGLHRLELYRERS